MWGISPDPKKSFRVESSFSAAARILFIIVTLILAVMVGKLAAENFLAVAADTVAQTNLVQ